MPSVEVNSDENKVRSSDQNTYQYNRKRCVIILRNVPIDATESEVSELFVPEHCALNGPVQYERVLQSNQNDCWYVKFTSEDDAQKAFLYLTRENVLIRGQKILVENYHDSLDKRSMNESLFFYLFLTISLGTFKISTLATIIGEKFSNSNDFKFTDASTNDLFTTVIIRLSERVQLFFSANDTHFSVALCIIALSIVSANDPCSPIDRTRRIDVMMLMTD